MKRHNFTFIKVNLLLSAQLTHAFVDDWKINVSMLKILISSQYKRLLITPWDDSQVIQLIQCDTPEVIVKCLDSRRTVVYFR